MGEVFGEGGDWEGPLHSLREGMTLVKARWNFELSHAMIQLINGIL